MTDSPSEGPTSLGPAILCSATSAVFVGLAGGFLVGAMAIVSPDLMTLHAADDPHELTDGQSALLIVLFAAAAACFAVATVSLTIAFRKLP